MRVVAEGVLVSPEDCFWLKVELLGDAKDRISFLDRVFRYIRARPGGYGGMQHRQAGDASGVGELGLVRGEFGRNWCWCSRRQGCSQG